MRHTYTEEIVSQNYKSILDENYYCAILLIYITDIYVDKKKPTAGLFCFLIFVSHRELKHLTSQAYKGFVHAPPVGDIGTWYDMTSRVKKQVSKRVLPRVMHIIQSDQIYKAKYKISHLELYFWARFNSTI